MRKAGQFQTIFDMKYSYKLILALCIIGLLSGCVIEEDDTPADAIDVLSVTGRILDHNNQPAENIPVSFYYSYGSCFGSYTLKKATSKTDVNGIYKLTVYRKKGERSDRGLQGSSYYIVPNLNEKKYFLNDIYETFSIEDFWIDRYHIIDDYVLWEAQYVKVIVKTKPKDAKGYDIECEYERPVNNFGGCGYSYTADKMDIKVPLHKDIKVPLHQDLKFTMKWDGKCNRTVFVKKDNLPKQIDLSYIPE